jgi:hypothetical protein
MFTVHTRFVVTRINIFAGDFYTFLSYQYWQGRRDRMVVGFKTICAISCLSPLEFESCSWRGVLDTTLCNKVCQ